jgi:catechol 2,3-dioxygenase-like lactoylglutathione lyase family enzyme
LIGHLSFGVRDLARAAAFYDAALGALGFRRVWDSEKGVGYGLEEGKDKLALIPREDAAPPAASFHLAFDAASRDAVDRFHAAALAAGGTCNGPAGFRPRYGAAYYAAFVIDPDGHRLEAVHQ